MLGPKNIPVEEKLEIILKGMSGNKTARQVCQEHNITPTLYYLLKRQAYQGMLEGLKPRKRGRKSKHPDPQTASLIRENQKLLKEKMQVEHLLSIAQRTLAHRRSQNQEKPSEGWIDGGKKEGQ